MIIVPLRLNTTVNRSTISNLVLISVTVLCYIVSVKWLDRETVELFVLTGWDLEGMIGCMFLHGGLFHLLGNMLFLYVFGNAVCSALGSKLYPAVYLLLGLIASASHLAFSDAPAVGASGAVNGIIGMSFMLFPANWLDCFYWIFWLWGGRFTVRAYWMILLWFVFDILGAMLGLGGTAYWAHIGGFAGGMLVGYLFIQFKWVKTNDPTLLHIIRGQHASSPEELAGDDGPTGMKGHEMTATTEIVLEDQNEFKRAQQAHQNDVDALHKLWSGEAEPVVETVASPPTPPPPRPVQKKTVPPPVLPPAPVRTSPAVMKLRILKAERKGNTITCFFVNDGDEIRAIKADAGPLLSVVFHPDMILKKRESGWMTLQSSGQELAEQVTVNCQFDDGMGGKGAYALVV